MDIPKFTFNQYCYRLEQHLNCKQLVSMTVLHGVCYSLMPLCINYRTKGQQYQIEISQILELDLPAIMPKFKKSRVDSQLHERYKRLVNTLAIILFNGVNAFV